MILVGSNSDILNTVCQSVPVKVCKIKTRNVKNKTN